MKYLLLLVVLSACSYRICHENKVYYCTKKEAGSACTLATFDGHIQACIKKPRGE